MIWKYDLKETVVMCSIRNAVEFPKNSNMRNIFDTC